MIQPESSTRPKTGGSTSCPIEATQKGKTTIN
jgi:hypothetical protein